MPFMRWIGYSNTRYFRSNDFIGKIRDPGMPTARRVLNSLIDHGVLKFFRVQQWSKACDLDV